MKMTPDKNFKLQTSSEKLLILEKSESPLFRLNNDLTHDYVGHDPGEDVFTPTLPPGISMSLHVKIPISQRKLKFKNKDSNVFVPLITFCVISLLSHSFGNEDLIFDPGIVSTSFPH